MSYRLLAPCPTRLIQYRPNQATPQALSAGTTVLWDTTTKVTTGGDSVSINGSTGVITLSSSHRYWLQVSIQVTRGSAGNFEFDWQTSTGTTLTPATGGFSLEYIEDYTDPVINSSLMASLMVSNPSQAFKFVCGSVVASSTLHPNTELLIWEFER